MTPDIWSAFALFAVVAAATPGPNNLLLLASGLRVGLWRSMPFVLGIGLGFGTLLVAAGFGLGRLFEAAPEVRMALKIGGTAYFLWLAWGLARAPGTRDAAGGRTPGFWAGAAFQAVNPKAWLMALTAVSLYLPQDWSFGTLALMVVIFLVLGLPANMAWAGAGQALARLVADPRRMRQVNVAMAAALILSILPVWLPVP